jgi:beta-galactosidase/beta-glucuronidase
MQVSISSPNGHVVAMQGGNTDGVFEFKVDSPQLWSPSSPVLYNLTVKMGSDEVRSYTGFRTVSSGVVNGVQRPLLNGKFEFMFGTLDQGYWPDGLHLPPNLDAMVYDLKVLKDLGMNMVRKHVRKSFQRIGSFLLFANG